MRIFSIPDHGYRIRIKELKYFNPKKWFISSRNMIQDIRPGSCLFTHPGSRGQKGTGSATLSIPLTKWSGSGRPKNILRNRLRIRIPNTAMDTEVFSVIIDCDCFPSRCWLLSRSWTQTNWPSGVQPARTRYSAHGNILLIRTQQHFPQVFSSVSHPDLIRSVHPYPVEGVHNPNTTCLDNFITERTLS